MKGLIGAAILLLPLANSHAGNNIAPEHASEASGALEWGGWIAAGFTGNPASPDNHVNTPVGFNDQSNMIQMNQLNLYLEKAINRDASSFDIGGRLDVMGGSDARFTQASGYWDANLINSADSAYYSIAIPQAYLEASIPQDLVHGLSAKIGHFYSIIGHESVIAPGNFFYSHAYTMLYGEPFVHTGMLLNGQISDQVSISAGAVTGPYNDRQVTGKDNNVSDIGNWNFLGGSTWISESGDTSLALAFTTGAMSSASNANRTMASISLTHNISQQWHYILQHDHGYQGSLNPAMDHQIWYGLNQYLIYDIDDQWSAGIRTEWFRDQNGGRVGTSPSQNNLLNPGSYYGLSAALNWRGYDWLLIRPEIRYDLADAQTPAFDDGTSDHQWLLSLSSVIQF